MLQILQLIFNDRKAIYLFIGGIVVGILLGMLLFWGIWPVEWEDGSPGHLYSDFQRYYFESVAEDYAQNRDLTLARRRLGLNLEGRFANPWVSEPETLEAFLNQMVADAGPGSAQERLAQDIAANIEGVSIPPDDEGGGQLSFLLIVGLLFAVLALVGLGFIVWTNFIAEKGTGEKQPGGAAAFGTIVEEEEEGEADEAGPALASYRATYELGDDFFDPSFSIEREGDFLGECGIGISESIGVADPKKVTALEAWLFDKSDIRTVTTVLASEYAFDDPTLKSKLEAKGDIVQIAPNKEVELETTALRVQVRVKDVTYAEGELPDRSFFQKVSVELRAWEKNPEAA
jgi:hypothetical protein